MNRYGAFSAGDPRPDMPNGQQNVVRPAGQTPLNPGDHFIPLNPFQRGGGPVNFPPGTFTSWLSHNGWSCARWSALTRPQQIQLLGAAMLSGDYSWTTRGNDSYNQQFRQRICLMYPSLCLPTLTPDELHRLTLSLQSGLTPAGQASIQFSQEQQQLSQLLQLINADCLRAAVNATNAPHPSVPISRIPR